MGRLNQKGGRLALKSCAFTVFPLLTGGEASKFLNNILEGRLTIKAYIFTLPPLITDGEASKFSKGASKFLRGRLNFRGGRLRGAPKGASSIKIMDFYPFPLANRWGGV